MEVQGAGDRYTVQKPLEALPPAIPGVIDIGGVVLANQRIATVAIALFTIVGAGKCLAFGTNGLIAVVLGTVTGVAGGVFRDVLLNELPLVFRPEIRLYATAAIGGAAVYVLAHTWAPGAAWPMLLGVGTTLALRLAAIRWALSLPVFEEEEPTPPASRPPDRGPDR